jgi:hypothetical protein
VIVGGATSVPEVKLTLTSLNWTEELLVTPM